MTTQTPIFERQRDEVYLSFLEGAEFKAPIFLQSVTQSVALGVSATGRLTAGGFEVLTTNTLGDLDGRYLRRAENLIDLADKAVSRTNLSVFSKAESVPKVGGAFTGAVDGVSFAASQFLRAADFVETGGYVQVGQEFGGRIYRDAGQAYDLAGALVVRNTANTADGTLVVGTLVVTSGSIRQYNVEEVRVDNQYIVVNQKQTSPALNGGLRVERGTTDAYMLWDEQEDLWGSKMGPSGTFNPFARTNISETVSALWTFTAGPRSTTGFESTAGNNSGDSALPAFVLAHSSGGLRHEVLSRHQNTTSDEQNQIAFRIWTNGTTAGLPGARPVREVLTLAGTGGAFPLRLAVGVALPDLGYTLRVDGPTRLGQTTEFGQGVSAFLHGYANTQVGRELYGQIGFRKDPRFSDRFGQFVVHAGQNGAVDTAIAMTFDIQGLLEAPRIRASRVVQAGPEKVGMAYTPGEVPTLSDLQYGMWAADTPYLHFRAAGVDTMLLTSDGRLGVGVSTAQVLRARLDLRLDSDAALPAFRTEGTAVVDGRLLIATTTVDSLYVLDVAGRSRFKDLLTTQVDASLQARFETKSGAAGQPGVTSEIRIQSGGYFVGLRTDPERGLLEVTDDMNAVRHRFTGDAYVVASNARIAFSSQSNFLSANRTAADVSLLRHAAGVLRTDATFAADGNLLVGTLTAAAGDRLTVAGPARIAGRLVVGGDGISLVRSNALLMRSLHVSNADALILGGDNQTAIEVRVGTDRRALFTATGTRLDGTFGLAADAPVGLTEGGNGTPGPSLLRFNINGHGRIGGIYTTGLGVQIGSELFGAGFGGFGWRMSKTVLPDTSEIFGSEWDTMSIRQTLTVYEIIAREISAVNGNLFISAQNEVEEIISQVIGTVPAPVNALSSGALYDFGGIAANAATVPASTGTSYPAFTIGNGSGANLPGTNARGLVFDRTTNNQARVSGLLAGLRSQGTTTTTALTLVWVGTITQHSAYSGIFLSRADIPTSGLGVAETGNAVGYNWSDAPVSYQWAGVPILLGVPTFLMVSVSAAGVTYAVAQGGASPTPLAFVQRAGQAFSYTGSGEFELMRDTYGTDRRTSGEVYAVWAKGSASTQADATAVYNEIRTRLGARTTGAVVLPAVSVATPVETPAPTGQTVLAAAPGALAAYSVRGNLSATFTGARTGTDRWIDQSGNGHHLIQANAADRPALLPDGWLFNSTGGGDFFDASTVAATGPTTVLVVARWDAVDGYRIPVDGISGSHIVGSGPSSGRRYLQRGGGEVMFGVNQRGYSVWVVTMNASNSSLRVNGETISSVEDVGNGALNGLRVGKAFNGTAPFEGVVHEVVVWNRVLTNAEHLAVEAAVARLNTGATYGTEVALDAPVSWFRSAETSGTTLVNSGSFGGSIPLTATGTARVPSLTADGGGAVSYTGGYATGATVEATTSTNITLECVVRVAGTGKGAFVSWTNSQAADNTTGQANAGMSIGWGDGTQDTVGSEIILHVGDVSWNATGILLSAGLFHLAATVDATGVVRLYVNGVLRWTSAGPTIPFLPMRRVSVGMHSGNGRTVEGVVDEAAIYTTALPAARIAAHARAVFNVGGSTPTPTPTPTPTAPPLAQFTATPTGLSVGVSNTSTSARPVTSYTWNWGDGSSSTGQNPAAHVYAAAGTYAVQLTVVDNAGGTSVAGLSIVVSSGSGSSFAPILDQIPGAYRAYGLTRIRTAHAGPLVRVRRSSDGTSLDIGHVNGELDVAALTAFCSGSFGRVTVWYDQSGNGKDAFQNTEEFQPILYDVNAVVTMEGKPALAFRTSFLEFESTSFLQGSFAFSYALDPSETLGILLSSGTENSQVRHEATNQVSFGYSPDALAPSSAVLGIPYGTPLVSQWHWTGTQVSFRVGANGTSTDLSGGTKGGPIPFERIGRLGNATPIKARIHTVVAWPDNKIADRVAIGQTLGSTSGINVGGGGGGATAGPPVSSTQTSFTSGSITPGASAPLLLEAVPGASAAYALYPLSTAYPGPAARVRRVSDGTEQNMQPGVFSGAATFVGASEGRVSVWHDQSGEGRDLLQSNHNLQPRLFAAGGVLDRAGDAATGDAALLHDALAGLIGEYSVVRPYTVLAVYTRVDSSVDAARAVQSRDGNWLIGPYQGWNAYYADGWVNAYGGLPVVAGQPVVVMATGSAPEAGYAAVSRQYVDGIDRTVNQNPAGALGRLATGAQGTYAEALKGHIVAVVVWPRVLSESERTTVAQAIALLSTPPAPVVPPVDPPSEPTVSPSLSLGTVTVKTKGRAKITTGSFVVGQMFDTDENATGGMSATVSFFRGLVTGQTEDTVTLEIRQGKVLVGMTLARYDHATDLNQRGSVYIATSDEHAPFQAVRYGNGSGAYPPPGGNETVRMGRLTGLQPFAGEVGVMGYGLAVGSVGSGGWASFRASGANNTGGVEFWQGVNRAGYVNATGFYIGNATNFLRFDAVGGTLELVFGGANLGTTLGGVNQSLTNLTTDLGIANTAITSANTAIGVANTAIGVANTAIGAVDGRVNEANTAIGVANTAIGAVDGRVNTANTAIGVANTAIGAVDGRVNATNTAVGTVNTRVDGQDATLGQHNTRITTAQTRADDAFAGATGSATANFIVEVRRDYATIAALSTYSVTSPTGTILTRSLAGWAAVTNANEASITLFAQYTSPGGSGIAGLLANVDASRAQTALLAAYTGPGGTSTAGLIATANAVGSRTTLTTRANGNIATINLGSGVFGSDILISADQIELQGLLRVTSAGGADSARDIDLQMYLPLDGHARDASTRGRNGVSHASATYGFGVIGKGLTGGYVTVPRGLLPQLTESFSVSFWLRTDNYNVRRGVLQTHYGHELNLTIEPFSGEFRSYVGNGVGGEVFQEWPGQPANVLSHYVYTRSVVDNVVTETLYRDSASLGNRTHTFAAVYTVPAGGSDLTVGKSHENANIGLLDEVRIYSRVLTPSQVRSLYIVPAGTGQTIIDGSRVFTGTLDAASIFSREILVNGGGGKSIAFNMLNDDGVKYAIQAGETNLVDTLFRLTYGGHMITQSGKIAATNFNEHDMWSGAATLAGATFVIGDQETTPKLALGAGADALGPLTTAPGLYTDALGRINLTQDAQNYLRFGPSGFGLAATRFTLVGTQGSIGLGATAFGTGSGFWAEANTVVTSANDGSWRVKRYAGPLPQTNVPTYSQYTGTPDYDGLAPASGLNPTSYIGSGYGPWADTFDNYHAIASIWIFVQTGFDISSSFVSDDQGGLYINEEPKVGSPIYTGSPIAYTHTFATGWHRIDMLWSEGGGGDYAALGWNPATRLEVTQIRSSAPSGTSGVSGAQWRVGEATGQRAQWDGAAFEVYGLTGPAVLRADATSVRVAGFTATSTQLKGGDVTIRSAGDIFHGTLADQASRWALKADGSWYLGSPTAFYGNAAGHIVFSGSLSGTTGTFSGTVTAGTATFGPYPALAANGVRFNNDNYWRVYNAAPNHTEFKVGTAGLSYTSEDDMVRLGSNVQAAGTIAVTGKLTSGASEFGATATGGSGLYVNGDFWRTDRTFRFGGGILSGTATTVQLAAFTATSTQLSSGLAALGNLIQIGSGLTWMTDAGLKIGYFTDTGQIGLRAQADDGSRAGVYGGADSASLFVIQDGSNGIEFGKDLSPGAGGFGGYMRVGGVNVFALTPTGLEIAGKVTATTGAIGGWTLGSSTLRTGLANLQNGTGVGLSLATANSGTGYSWTGGRLLTGLTVAWHLAGSHAGHLAVGQIMTDQLTLKTGFFGLQMIPNAGQEVFVVSAKVDGIVGAPVELHNRIAGWVFDAENLYKGTSAGAPAYVPFWSTPGNFTGLRLTTQGGGGAIYGYSGGVRQATFDVDGVITAGGGAVVLDALGIRAAMGYIGSSTSGWTISPDSLFNSTGGGIYLSAGLRRITIGVNNTYDNSAAGIFLGNEGAGAGVPKFRLKDALRFDGSTLVVSGDITASNLVANTGFIAGWVFDAGGLNSGSAQSNWPTPGNYTGVRISSSGAENGMSAYIGGSIVSQFGANGTIMAAYGAVKLTPNGIVLKAGQSASGALSWFDDQYANAIVGSIYTLGGVSGGGLYLNYGGASMTLYGTGVEFNTEISATSIRSRDNRVYLGTGDNYIYRDGANQNLYWKVDGQTAVQLNGGGGGGGGGGAVSATSLVVSGASTLAGFTSSGASTVSARLTGSQIGIGDQSNGAAYLYVDQSYNLFWLPSGGSAVQLSGGTSAPFANSIAVNAVSQGGYSLKAYDSTGGAPVNIDRLAANEIAVGDQVSGASYLYRDGSSNLFWKPYNSGAVQITSGASLSDLRFKTDLQELAPELVDHLTGYSFRYTDDAPEHAGEARYGVVAQDVEAVLPRAVTERDGVRYVDERQIIPALVSAVKNARARIASLEKTLSDVLQRLMLAGL